MIDVEIRKINLNPLINFILSDHSGFITNLILRYYPIRFLQPLR